MTKSERTGMISRRNLILRAGAGMVAASFAPALLQVQPAKAEAISDLTPDGALQKIDGGESTLH